MFYKTIPFFLLFSSFAFALENEEDFTSLAPNQGVKLTEKFQIKDFSSEDFKIREPIFKEKSVTAATIFSSLIPGLGHYYLGDYQTAGIIFGSYALGISGIFLKNHELSSTSSSVMSCSSFYGTYAAYRDARALRAKSDYEYEMPNNSFSSLLTAPFSASVMKKPEVWGGIIGSLALAGVVGHFLYPEEGTAEMRLSLESTPFPMAAFPVGIGEESFFRGYLQPAFSEFATPKGGIILSSLLFGAAHIPNAAYLPKEHRWRYYAYSLPLITSLGAYFGWLTHKNRSLRESVAIHAWYDFALFLGGYLASKATVGRNEFAFHFTF